jgi:hypothetical protein
MIKLLGLGIIAFALLAEGQLPSSAVGKWTVGKPYDAGQPVGLDAKQEGAIVGLVIKVSPSQIAVCGKDVPITSVKVDHLTSSDFLAKYNFTPNLIRLGDANILDINLNKLHSTKACGEFADPGTHLLISKGHAVVEVGNDYFRLTK